MELVLLMYRITQRFPVEEKYGLASQMRRCVVSISSNIAEGHMRKTNKDFQQFLSIARGSCAELETQVLIAEKLCYIPLDDYQQAYAKLEEISKMLSSLYSKLTS